ncbi:hypothetical protein C8R47DRAFT_1206198 [Mycena vitilis]|nr:hypothetical protein C8R47DRAFT_1206198 [Mycena vitilis]
MTETVINADNDQISSALAAWSAFDDETRPDALRVLAFALVLRQQRMIIDLQSVFVAACKKSRENSSLRNYKKREDARRALSRCRRLPDGVPEDCPVVVIDGVIEVLPLDGEDSDDSLISRDDDDDNNSDQENQPPRTFSEIDADESDGHSMIQDEVPASSDADSTAAVQSHEDAATAADTLDALADLPSPLLGAGLLPSPQLPSPKKHKGGCRQFDIACRYAYGPPGLEGQATDGEDVGGAWVRRGAAEEHEFRQGFARGLARAWEMALAPPSSPGQDRPDDDRPEHVQEEWDSLTQLLAPGRDQPHPSELKSGDLTLAEIQEVENAWVRVLRAAQRENEEQREVTALLVQGRFLFNLDFCLSSNAVLSF